MSLPVASPRATLRSCPHPGSRWTPSSTLSFPSRSIAVAIVLLLGLFNMLRGGSATAPSSLMRVRVLLQFVAIVVIMGVIWWRAV